jgi:hypothetical protein
MEVVLPLMAGRSAATATTVPIRLTSATTTRMSRNSFQCSLNFFQP